MRVEARRGRGPRAERVGGTRGRSARRKVEPYRADIRQAETGRFQDGSGSSWHPRQDGSRLSWRESDLGVQ
jgi:hypothetical protein